MRASPRPVKKAGLMISSKLIFDNYYLGRLCTKTLILVSVERSVQYRERSAAVAHSTLRLNCDGSLSVPSGRFARGTVLLVCYFLCKPSRGKLVITNYQMIIKT